MAEVKRIDDLIAAAVMRMTEKIDSVALRLDSMSALRASHIEQLALAEAKRIDAIRAVDVNAVSIANERATQQAVVLANQVAASADALRTLVSTTANTVATQLQQLQTQLSDRISALERSQYTTSGSSGGMRDMWGWVFAAVGVIVSIGLGIFASFRG